MDPYADDSETMTALADQPDYSGGTAEMPVSPVGTQPPADLPAREAGPGGHTMTIYQGGRREDYRFQPNARGQLEINPEDYAAGQQRAQFSEQERKLALRAEFSHADSLHLQQLQAARSNIERDKLSGLLNDREANSLLGQVMAGASELQARQLAQRQKTLDQQIHHQNALEDMSVVRAGKSGNVFTELSRQGLIPEPIKHAETGEVIGHAVPLPDSKGGVKWHFEKAGGKGESDADLRKQAEANVFVDKKDPKYAAAVEAQFNTMKTDRGAKGKSKDKTNDPGAAGQGLLGGGMNAAPGEAGPSAPPAQAVAQNYATPPQAAAPDPQASQAEFNSIRTQYKKLSDAPPEVQQRYWQLKSQMGG